MILQRVDEFCKEMNQSNKTNDKIKILEKYGHHDESFRKLLQSVYHSSVVFNVRSKNIKKYKETKYNKDKKDNKNNKLQEDDIVTLLNQLAGGFYTGHDTLEHICDFLTAYPQYESLVCNILDKNLKIRISSSILQKVFPLEFPTFHVSLAKNYNPKYLDEGNWFISRKLDGVRCLCMIEADGSISLLSRNRKPFHTLSLLQQELTNSQMVRTLIEKHGGGVLDGEIIDNYEKDSFKKIMEQISRKNYTLENFEYRIFDYIPIEDFQRGKSKLIFRERLQIMETLFSPESIYCKLLPQSPYSKENLNKWIEKLQTNQWEGLMLRKDTVWQGKRSNDLLKYKIMHDEEFQVLDVENGPFRVIDAKTGLETEILCLSSITIDYHQTKVGSGFSLEDRIKFYENPELIKNKYVTVKYFEKTEKSLRFPIYKSIRNEV